MAARSGLDRLACLSAECGFAPSCTPPSRIARSRRLAGVGGVNVDPNARRTRRPADANITVVCRSVDRLKAVASGGEDEDNGCDGGAADVAGGTRSPRRSKTHSVYDARVAAAGKQFVSIDFEPCAFPSGNDVDRSKSSEERKIYPAATRRLRSVKMFTSFNLSAY